MVCGSQPILPETVQNRGCLLPEDYIYVASFCFAAKMKNSYESLGSTNDGIESARDTCLILPPYFIGSWIAVAFDGDRPEERRCLFAWTMHYARFVLQKKMPIRIIDTAMLLIVTESNQEETPTVPYFPLFCCVLIVTRYFFWRCGTRPTRS